LCDEGVGRLNLEPLSNNKLKPKNYEYENSKKLLEHYSTESHLLFCNVLT